MLALKKISKTKHNTYVRFVLVLHATVSSILGKSEVNVTKIKDERDMSAMLH